jgi:hypothetical protein
MQVLLLQQISPLFAESPRRNPLKYYHLLGSSHISVKPPLSSQTSALYCKMPILTVLKEEKSSRMFFLIQTCLEW